VTGEEEGVAASAAADDDDDGSIVTEVGELMVDDSDTPPDASAIVTVVGL
jgi:hypothetical protein